jgi:Mrp family chromosome partitioning ATPase
VGRQSDGVVLVVRANRYPIAVNQEARELLLQSGNSLLGTILNDFRPSTKLDYLRQYSAYAKS